MDKVDGKGTAFETLVMEYRGKARATACDKLDLLRRLKSGGYTFSLERIDAYLEIAANLPFLEQHTIKTALVELVNLDTSLHIDYDTMSEREWEELLADAQYSARAPGCRSPGSSGDESIGACFSDAKSKLAVIIKGVISVLEYARQRRTMGVFTCVMQVFEDHILPSFGSLCVQFVIFVFCAADELYCERLISFLLRHLIETYDLRRPKMACYLGSFVARCRVLSPGVLAYFADIYVPFAKRKASASGASPPDTLSVLIIQNLLYISCFKPGVASHADFKETLCRAQKSGMLSGVNPSVRGVFVRKYPQYAELFAGEGRSLSDTPPEILEFFPFDPCPITPLQQYMEGEYQSFNGS